MADGKNVDVSVYVETTALVGWSSKMEEINSSAVEVLNKFKTTVGDLNDSWAGNSASGFLTASEALINKTIAYHDEMANVEQFLIKVVNTMEDQ